MDTVEWVKFRQLFCLLQDLSDQVPPNIALATASLPAANLLPPPAAIWAFFAVCEYREQQQWARRQLLTHMPNMFYTLEEQLNKLSAELERLEAESPTQYFPESIDSGPDCFDVPGMSGWFIEQFFSCNYVLLIGRRSRDKISVSLLKHTNENILFPEGIPSQMPGSDRLEPIGRFADLTRTTECRSTAVEELIRAHLLIAVDYALFPCESANEPDGYRLTIRGDEYSPVALDVIRLWSEPHRRSWLAALLGDWALAYELASRSGNQELARAAAERLGLNIG